VSKTSESLQAAFKYLFVSELHALKQLAQSLPANPVVINLGAGAGTSGLAFMESRPDLKLKTFDVQLESHPFGCLEAEMDVIRQAGFNLDRYWQFVGDSKAWGKRWQEAIERGVTDRADMVFVDADHSYSGCKGDILSWLPNIKPGGIMAVHDYNKKEVYKDGPIENAPHPKLWQGVDRAVRRFLCPHYEIILQEKTLIAFRIGEQN
jgi:predicted O-methyltransferase YrrM